MIVSTTLTASNADLIGDALASVVAQVDRCLVIDTGARDDTLEVARRVAGEKLLVREFPWQNDFGAARNFALDAAREAGAEWAVTVDTDERLIFDGGFDLHRALAATQARVLRVIDEPGYYSKERIVRLPAEVRWVGPTHEALRGQRDGETEDLSGVRFRELPKDADALRRKFERDVAVLRQYTRRHPKDARWHYYLGASHQDLGQYAAAIDAYRTCAKLDGWVEQAAWAYYRAAECCCALERWKEAIEFCAKGLALRPATAELAWLAGYAALKAKRYEDAIAWSNMAVVNGLHDGAGASFPRVGFRHPPALYEGPYDVLHWTFKALGNAAAAEEALREREAAKRAREAAGRESRGVLDSADRRSQSTERRYARSPRGAGWDTGKAEAPPKRGS
jgi:tetratricopeptide (TPR) repeat protein